MGPSFSKRWGAGHRPCWESRDIRTGDPRGWRRTLKSGSKHRQRHRLRESSLQTVLRGFTSFLEAHTPESRQTVSWLVFVQLAHLLFTVER